MLADRVIVMSHRPARIKEIVPIDFDTAVGTEERIGQRRDSPEAATLARHISSLLEAEEDARHCYA